jgi:AcrR family transcriptional regulator
MWQSMSNTLNAVEVTGAPSSAPRKAAPRQRDADQTKINILNAALAEFADKGLAGARVDEIAKNTAASKHMIYYYFGNKEGLYRAVLESAYKNFRSAEQAIDYLALDPIEALSMLVGLSFDFHIKYPQYVRIIMGENINNGEHIQHIEKVEDRRAILDTIAEIVGRGAADGIFRQGIDSLHLHMTISALCFYYVSNRFTFGHIFGVNLEDPKMLSDRRATIVDAALKICLARAD